MLSENRNIDFTSFIVLTLSVVRNINSKTHLTASTQCSHECTYFYIKRDPSMLSKQKT